MIRERLSQLMEAKKWNQSDLARELGEHRNWVNKRITGQTEIKADEIPRLAAALGVSPCAFFEEELAAVEPAVEQAAERAAKIAVERMRQELREELRATMAELLPRGQTPPEEPRVAEGEGPYKPSLAEIWARGRVRQWERLSEAKQRRILEILEEPEGAPEEGGVGPGP
ncbi:MAG: helix-turn-helix domain-containing protein [Sphingomonadaceae bacterium]